MTSDLSRKIAVRMRGMDVRKASSIVAALSGGADSVCLLHALYAIRETYPFTLYAAHLNHGIRGVNADRDEAYCASLCASKGIRLYTERADVPELSRAGKQSIETAARDARYAFFARARAFFEADYVATAHNANDDLETMLFNLIRGTGIFGLSGIPEKREFYIRPLLSISRAEIIDYLSGHGVQYMVDDSNFDERYTRNRIRSRVIPALSEINPQIFSHVENSKKSLLAAGKLIDTHARNAALQAVYDRDGVRFSTELVKEMNDAVFARFIAIIFARLWVGDADVCKDSPSDPPMLSSKHIEGIRKLVYSVHPSKRIRLPGNIAVRREYADLILERVQESGGISPVCLLIDEKTAIPGTDLYAKMRKCKKNEQIQNSFNTFYMDCDNILSVTLRARMPGDRIVLEKTGRSRELRRLFIDRKIPVLERERIPVITDGENRVLAVYGIGVSRPFAAKDAEHAFCITIFRE